MRTEITEEGRTEMAKAISAALGAEWTIEPPKSEGYLWWRRIRNTAGHTCFLSWEGDYKNGDRINISGEWPKTADGVEVSRYNSDPAAPSISVAVSRGVPVIAREIQRRFMPDYLALYTVLAERATDQNSHADKTRANVRRLLVANGQPPTKNDGDHRQKEAIYLRESHGYMVRVSGDSIRFEPFSCPMEVALKVIDLLKTKPKSE